MKTCSKCEQNTDVDVRIVEIINADGSFDYTAEELCPECSDF